MSHWGPTVTSILSIILTMVVWLSGKQLTERQVKLQEEQNQAELADMRTKFFGDLMAKDETKRILAEIGLAGHGQKAMPVVHLALGIEVAAIRGSGVNVVHRLFQAETTSEGRMWLLRQLTQEEFKSPNKTLRLGVVQSLVKIEPLLEPDERQFVTAFLKEHVSPENVCSDQEGRDMVHEAAMFHTEKNATPVDYLLTAAGVPRCGNGWRQALLKLDGAAARLAPAQRADLREKLVRLKGTVLENLRRTVSDEELAAGIGIEAPAQGGRLVIDFEGFRQEVEKQFDELLSGM